MKWSFKNKVIIQKWGEKFKFMIDKKRKIQKYDKKRRDEKFDRKWGR